MSHRMHHVDSLTNSREGQVVWSPTKSLWYSSMLVVAVVGGALTFSWTAAMMAGILTAATLCFGHSVGLHRLLIHRSFECPRWLEHCMVYTGVLVGMGGPRKMIYMHDIRDWSQRHRECHSFFIHDNSLWKDWCWNLHCEIRLTHPPEFHPERRVAESRLYRFMDDYWMLMQLPLAIALYVIGGWSWVIWGVAVRVALSLTGHWLVGYLAHHVGSQSWIVRDAAVQGYNVHGLGLITMGEAWHNNHHAFPESAQFGLDRGQLDAGWWLLCALCKFGLVWNTKQPADLPDRPELMKVTDRRQIEPAHSALRSSSLIRAAQR